MKTGVLWVLACGLATSCGPADQEMRPEANAIEETGAIDQAGAIEADGAIAESGAIAPGGPAEGAFLRPSAEGGDLVQGDTVPGLPSWTRQDWEVLRATLAWAWEAGIDRLPVGERVARIGETFVGAPYVPQTLDPPGPERLVINLRALDCVTLVENALALARFVREAPRDVLERPEEAMRGYQQILTGIRYRGGEMDGYPSRLHYFSEWLTSAEDQGFVDLVTEELGGEVDPEPITFMTRHREAYRQLAGRENFEAIGRIEARLSASPRRYIPQEGVGAVASEIRTGDIIAATSTLEGLDVAHTGIALWKDGVLHLMHAPLVGKTVEISEKPLAERLLGIRAQDGIMVARPKDAT